MGPLNPHLFLILTARIAPLCATLALWACDTGAAAHMAGQAANRIESTMVSGAETLKTAGKAVQDRLGLGPPASKEETKPRARGTNAHRTRRPPDSPDQPPAVTPPDPAPTNTFPQEVLEPGPPVSSSDESLNAAGGNDGPLPGPIADATIYSRANPEVIPPRLVRGQVSTPIFLGAEPSVNEIELVLSAEGRVEQLQLLSKPRRLTDVQLLNGAKAWEFEPARRAGVPVRYRLTVTWDATP